MPVTGASPTEPPTRWQRVSQSTWLVPVHRRGAWPGFAVLLVLLCCTVALLVVLSGLGAGIVDARLRLPGQVPFQAAQPGMSPVAPVETASPSAPSAVLTTTASQPTATATPEPTPTQPPTPVPAPPPATPVPVATAAPLVHVVSQGDTLFAIARRYGVSVDDIRRANNLGDPDLIVPGQRLIIPRG
jgi:LysM repeat protein